MFSCLPQGGARNSETQNTIMDILYFFLFYAYCALVVRLDTDKGLLTSKNTPVWHKCSVCPINSKSNVRQDSKGHLELFSF